jgi:hypothetical protein
MGGPVAQNLLGMKFLEAMEADGAQRLNFFVFYFIDKFSFNNDVKISRQQDQSIPFF